VSREWGKLTECQEIRVLSSCGSVKETLQISRFEILKFRTHDTNAFTASSFILENRSNDYIYLGMVYCANEPDMYTLKKIDLNKVGMRLSPGAMMHFHYGYTLYLIGATPKPKDLIESALDEALRN
jgi:hypothetical protein